MRIERIKNQVINYLKIYDYTERQISSLYDTETLEELLTKTLDITSKVVGKHDLSKLRLIHSYSIVKSYDNVIKSLVISDKLDSDEEEILKLDEEYSKDIRTGLFLHDIFKFLDNGIEHGENAANALDGLLPEFIIDAIRVHSRKSDYYSDPLINLFMDLDRLSKSDYSFIIECCKCNDRDYIKYISKRKFRYTFRLKICDEMFNHSLPNVLNLFESFNNTKSSNNGKDYFSISSTIINAIGKNITIELLNRINYYVMNDDYTNLAYTISSVCEDHIGLVKSSVIGGIQISVNVIDKIRLDNRFKNIDDDMLVDLSNALKLIFVFDNIERYNKRFKYLYKVLIGMGVDKNIAVAIKHLDDKKTTNLLTQVIKSEADKAKMVKAKECLV